jgi:carbohydrate-binding DOMON domain-containing protein
MGASISDACTSDANLDVSHVDTSTGTCPVVVTRTYTVTDACGNASTTVQIINVDDTTAPSITGTLDTLDEEGCSASDVSAAVTTVAGLEAMGVSISDACTNDAGLVVTYSDSSSGTCPVVVTRTYTVTDACGNASTVTQTINVDDTIAPSIAFGGSVSKTCGTLEAGDIAFVSYHSDVT